MMINDHHYDHIFRNQLYMTGNLLFVRTLPFIFAFLCFAIRWHQGPHPPTHVGLLLLNATFPSRTNDLRISLKSVCEWLSLSVRFSIF